MDAELSCIHSRELFVFWQQNFLTFGILIAVFTIELENYRWAVV
ncbi:hypothetical protein [Nocardia yamanashiensis]|nr:hypothetical protein [Nocardia yamanashiensis]